MLRARRIIIFSLAYYPRFVGGAEVAVKEVTDRISSDEAVFHLITLQFDAAFPREERIGNVTVHRVGWGKKSMTTSESFDAFFYVSKIAFIPLAALKAYRLHRRLCFDGAWAMMSYMQFPLVLLRFFGARIPYVVTLQEGDPFEHVFGRWRIKIFLPLLRCGFRGASFLVGESTFLERWGRQMGYGGKSAVIPNAVDTEYFLREIPPDETAAYGRKLGKQEGGVFLITTSRLVGKNAADDVIKALPLLPDNIHFAILGTGPDEEMLKELAKREGVVGRVHFLGFVEQKEIPKYLKASDIFIRPSLSEGMGNSFIEAMAAGLPVIATQVGGIADFLFDPERNPDRAPTGRAVTSRDPEGIARAVHLYLDNPEETKKIIKNAQELVVHDYDWSKIASGYRKVFASVGAPHVFITTPLYPPEIGGPAIYSKLLEEELPKRDIDVSVLPFRKVRKYPKVVRHFVYFLKVFFGAGKTDVIFALDPVSVGLPACLAAFFLRKRFVVKVVGDYAWEQYLQRNKKQETRNKFITPDEFQKGRYDWMTELRRKIERRVARRADRIIVPSEYLKKIVMMWGVDSEKISVIYNAFEPPILKKTKEELREELGLEGTVIISAGRLVPWKGFKTLIEVMPDVEEKVPDARLVIIGEGPEREDVRCMMYDLGLENAVFLKGKLPHNELLKYLKAADLFVLNTGYEGFSHMLLEAAAVGTPIVTTNTGGNPEIIKDGENGILIEYDDRAALKKAVVALACNGEKQKKFAAAGKEIAERFSKERMLEATEGVLCMI